MVSPVVDPRLNDVTQNWEQVKSHEGTFNPGRQEQTGWLMTSLLSLETPHRDGLFCGAVVHVASSDLSSDFEIGSFFVGVLRLGVWLSKALLSHHLVFTSPLSCLPSLPHILASLKLQDLLPSPESLAAGSVFQRIWANAELFLDRAKAGCPTIRLHSNTNGAAWRARPTPRGEGSTPGDGRSDHSDASCKSGGPLTNSP